MISIIRILLKPLQQFKQQEILVKYVENKINKKHEKQ